MVATNGVSPCRSWCRALTIGAVLVCAAPFGGCGALPFLAATPAVDDDPTAAKESTITADVTSAAPDTGLPRALSGTVSGWYEGTYDEEILEVFFDDEGAPLAAMSRSQFTFTEPQEGTLTTLNFITVVETIIGDDGAGAAVPIGLRTAATGDIVYSTGDYEDVAGQLRTDSNILFGGGEFALGTLDSTFVVTLSR